MAEHVVEHAIGYAGGSMLVRSVEAEDEYPLDRWIASHQRNGGKVYRRAVVVVEGWTEVPRG